eukprot:Sspe_Gene.36584::Locus_17675_Transcript_1_1_Confidence_1.000_Length_998::g.36584::m.36584
MGMVMLVAHAVCSVQLFYGKQILDIIVHHSRNVGKKMKYEVEAVHMGIVGMVALLLATYGKPYLWGTRNSDNLIGAGLLLGLLHFFFIETPTGYFKDLPVRPFGYTAMIVPTLALIGKACRSFLPCPSCCTTTRGA